MTAKEKELYKNLPINRKLSMNSKPGDFDQSLEYEPDEFKLQMQVEEKIE